MSGIIGVAGNSGNNSNRLQLRILRFWTDYVKRAGATVAVDKVEYCKPGMATKETTVSEIARLRNIREDVDMDNPAAMMARERWAAIGPAYEAWKRGEEMPVNGTPLAATGIFMPQQIEVLKMTGFRTIEEFADASDSVASKVPLPGVRELQLMAKRYMETADQRKTNQIMAEHDEKMKAMLEEMRDMKEMMSLLEQENKELHASRGDAKPARRRAEQPAEAAAAS